MLADQHAFVAEAVAQPTMPGRATVLRFAQEGAKVMCADHRLDSAYVNCIVKKRLKQAGVQDVSAYSAESLRKR